MSERQLNIDPADPHRRGHPSTESRDLQPNEPSLFDPRLYDGTEASVHVDPMEARQEFHDPIHGFVEYTRREIQVIDHPAFQRLFKVYQLGQTHLVFRGATHSRGQHSLGTVAALKLLMDATDNTSRRQHYIQAAEMRPNLQWWTDRRLDQTERAFARLAALLHDVGHIVNGHTIEDELGLLHNHGSRQRLEIILDKTDWLSYPLHSNHARAAQEPTGSPSDGNVQPPQEGRILKVEALRERIDRLYASFAEEANVWTSMAPSLESNQSDVQGREDDQPQKLSASDILVEIIVRNDDRQALDVKKAESDGRIFRLSVLRDLVGNTVCADLIDYLQRDWHHIGRPRHLDTRLLQYMEIVTNGRESRLVVNLRSNQDGRSRPDVMSAILELLENRYHLWEAALLHRTKTCASAMLERAIMEQAAQAGLVVRDRSGSDSHPTGNGDANIERDTFSDIERPLLEGVLESSDADAYRALANCSWPESVMSEGGWTGGIAMDEKDLAFSLLGKLDARMLHKEIVRVDFGPYSKSVSDLLSPSKATRIERFEAARRRLVSLNMLESDFELEPGSLVMYCLPFGLGKKLAEVAVAYGDRVSSLTELDADMNISGGHLAAQLNRYDGLWRASLFASKSARQALKSRALIGTVAATFKLAVLGISDVDVTMYDLAKIASVERSELAYARNGKLRENVILAALGNDNPHHYPTGQPSLRSHFLSDAV